MFFSTMPLKKGLLLCSTILSSLALMQPVLAQETSRLFYLAQQDTNQDGLFSDDDLTQLFTWDGTQTQPLSTPDTGNVVLYAADNRYAAYISDNGATQSLSVRDLAAGTTLTQPLSSTPVTQMVLKNDRVWLITRSDDDKPLAIAYNLATLAVEGQRAAKLADTQFSFQGDWLFAYNPTGLINVFAMPSLDPVTVPLEEYSLSVPSWAPTQTQFQYLATSSAAPTDQFIALVDVTTGQSRRLDVPDMPADAFSQALWSPQGTTLVFQSSGQEDTLRLINTTSGEETVLSEPDYRLAPFSWSNNDRWFIYKAASTFDTSTEMILYDTETDQSTLLKNPDTSPITFSWSPDSSTLLVLSQFGNQAQYGLFSLNAPSFDQWLVQVSGDVSLAQGGVLWLDSDHIALTQKGTLLLLDLSTGLLMPLTDNTQQVIANRVSQG